MKLEDIKQHWEESGKSFPFDSKVTPTSRDPYLGELERKNILSFLKKEHFCLEIGCGDAYHTIHYAKKIKQLLGVDVAQSLIDLARMRVQEKKMNNISFSVCSALDLGTNANISKFDCIISQRCLINLPTWELQKNAITQIYEILNNDGIFLMTEGFQENLDNLNSIRERFSLPGIKVVDYNRNFIKEDFDKFIRKYFEIVEIRHYGSYLFFSRLFHPLAVFPENPKHDSKINETAKKLQEEISMPEYKKYSYNLFYALRKRKS